MSNLDRREARYQRRKAKREKKILESNSDYFDFDKVFSYSNLYKSYKKCCSGVGWKASTQSYKSQAVYLVYKAYLEVRKPKYKGRGFICFTINLRGKTRNIKSVHISERVIQRCFCDYCLVPIFRKYFIYDNAASLKGRGISFAIERTVTHLEQFYREWGLDGYVLKFDVSKYFESISHEYLFAKIAQKLRNERLRELLYRFIGMFGTRGLGLGSQVSQVSALLFLNEVDHIVKDFYRVKQYARYQDDGHLIHHDKEFLLEVLAHLKKVLKEKMNMNFNERKTQIIALKKGFTFLKVRYSLTKTGKVVRRPPSKSITAQKRKLRKFKIWVDEGRFTIRNVYDSLQSWRAYLSHHSICNRSVANVNKLYTEIYGLDPFEIPPLNYIVKN